MSGSLGSLVFTVHANVTGAKKNLNSLATNVAEGTKRITTSLQKTEMGLQKVTKTWIVSGGKWKQVGTRMQSAAHESFTGMMKTMLNFKTFMAKIMHYITFSIGVQLVMGLRQALTSMISTFSDFQHSATMAASVSGRLGASLGDMRSKIEAMGIELGKTSIFMATEATEAFYSLASAGFDVANRLDEMGDQASDILRPFTDFAAAVGADLPEATELVSKTIKMFGYELENAREIVDMFTGAITNSFLTFKRLADGMQYVGAIAGALSVTLQDTTAALATLTDRGMSGSQAGRRLRMILTKLIDPTEKGKKALNELGVTMDMLNPATHTLSEIFLTLQTSGYKAVHAAKMFRGATAGAAAALVDSADSIDMYIHKFNMATGVTERLAEVQKESFWGQLELLKAAFESLSLELGSVLLPIMKGMANFIKKDFIPGLQKIGSIISSLAPGLEVTASGVQDFIKSLVKLLAVAGGAAVILNTVTKGLITMKMAFLGLIAPVALLGITFGEFSESGEGAVDISKMWLPILASLAAIYISLVRAIKTGTVAKISDTIATFANASANAKLASVLSYLTGLRIKEFNVSKSIISFLKIITGQRLKETLAAKGQATALSIGMTARSAEAKSLIGLIALYRKIIQSKIANYMTTKIENTAIGGRLLSLSKQKATMKEIIGVYGTAIAVKMKDIVATRISNITGGRTLTLNRLKKVSLLSLVKTYATVAVSKYKDIALSKLSELAKLKELSLTNILSAATGKLAAIKNILALSSLKELAISVKSAVVHGIQAVALFVLGGAALTTAGFMTILSASMLPITAIALAVVAAIGAVVYLFKNWGKVSGKLGKKIKPFMNALETIGKIVATVVVVGFKILYKLVSWVWDKLVGFATFIYDTLKPAFDALGAAIKAICDGLGMIWEFLKTVIPGFQELEDIVVDTAKDIMGVATETEKFAEALSETSEFLDKFVDKSEEVTSILDIQARAFQKAKEEGIAYEDVMLEVTKAEAELLGLEETYMSQMVSYEEIFDGLTNAKEELSKAFGEFTGELRNQSKALSLAISKYNEHGEITDEVLNKIKDLSKWEFQMFQEYMNASSALNSYNQTLIKYNQLNAKRNILQRSYNDYQKLFDERLKSIHDKQQKLYNIRLKMYKLQHDEVGSYEDLFNSLAKSGQITDKVKSEYQEMMQAQSKMISERSDYTSVLGDMDTGDRESMTKWVESYVSALDSGASKEEAMAQANQQSGITFSDFAGLTDNARNEILEYANASAYANQQANEFREVAMGLAGDLVNSGQATSDIANQYYGILKNVSELQENEQEYNDIVEDKNQSLEETKNLIATVGRLWQYFQEVQGVDKDSSEILELMAAEQGTLDELMNKYGSMEAAINDFYNTNGKSLNEFNDTQKMTFMTAIDMLDEQGQSLDDLDYTTLADSLPIREFWMFEESVNEMVTSFESAASEGENSFDGLAETIDATFTKLMEHLNYLNKWVPDESIEVFYDLDRYLKNAEPIDLDKIIDWDKTMKQFSDQNDLVKFIAESINEGTLDPMVLPMVMAGMSSESPEEYFARLPDEYRLSVLNAINNSSLEIKVDDEKWNEIKDDFKTFQYPTGQLGIDTSGAETAIDELDEYIKNNITNKYTITFDIVGNGNNENGNNNDFWWTNDPASNWPPEFAKGIIANAPTLGIFGEAGAEALVPLEGSNRNSGLNILQSIIPKYFPELLMANGGITHPTTNTSNISTSNIAEYNFYGDFNISGIEDSEDLVNEFFEKLKERRRMR